MRTHEGTVELNDKTQLINTVNRVNVSTLDLVGRHVLIN